MIGSLDTRLIPLEDAHFPWMLGQGSGPADLALPPGGVDTPETLRVLRRMIRALHAAGSRGAWLIVSGDEVVGLCSYKQAPKDGQVEIGYGVAVDRRRRGHATRAVAAMLTFAIADPLVTVVAALIAADNAGSLRAVERNGFTRSGTVNDAEDGELLLWQKDLA